MGVGVGLGIGVGYCCLGIGVGYCLGAGSTKVEKSAPTVAVIRFAGQIADGSSFGAQQVNFQSFYKQIDQVFVFTFLYIISFLLYSRHAKRLLVDLLLYVSLPPFSYRASNIRISKPFVSGLTRPEDRQCNRRRLRKGFMQWIR